MMEFVRSVLIVGMRVMVGLNLMVLFWSLFMIVMLMKIVGSSSIIMMLMSCCGLWW